MSSRSSKYSGLSTLRNSALHPDHEKLSRSFFRRELAQSFLRPIFARRGRNRWGPGSGICLFLVLGKSGQGEQQKIKIRKSAARRFEH